MRAQDLILVPLDGSAVSEEAVPLAVNLARRMGGSLHLVHVHMPITADPIHVEGLPVIDEDMRSLQDPRVACSNKTACSIGRRSRPSGREE